MNRKQWFVLAGLFFLLFIRLSWSANFYDKFQWKFGDLALEALETNSSHLSDTFQGASQAFMINDNIYRMGSGFALFLALGFFICGFLEPKRKSNSNAK